VNSGGQPIAGASVDVLARDAGSASMRVLAHARTGADGSFLANVPPGSSRVVEIAYRAFDSDAGYTARASVQETVSAGVALRVTPRRTASTGTIRLSGQVQGQIPVHGVIVELLVHYRGHWEPLRTPRTGPDGRFKVPYQFQGAVGRFPFRAEVFGGQAGFPYATGASKSVDVKTR
jgi:5-hydroxyisourate hydrolase-like protein (transthyretin family)